jgi:capsular exopolysaccharide synthesis family protein
MQESILKERSSRNTMRDFYNIVFRHKQKLILFFVSVMIAVSLGTFLMPDIYQSNGKLLVRMGRESTDIVDPTAPAGRERISLSQNRENELNSEMEILTSEELVGEVVDAIGVKAILKGKSTGKKEQPSSVTPKQNQGRNKAIRKLMKNLKVEVVKKSNIIALAYEAKAPKLASDVLTKLIDYYLEKRFSVYRTEGAYNFFKQQKEKLYNALAQTEKQIRDTKNRTNIGALLEQRPLLLERISALQTEIESNESALVVSKAKADVLQVALVGLPKRLITKEISGQALTAADQMRTALNQLELKEDEILSSFTENSIYAKEIRRQIAEARELLANAMEAKTVETGINETHQKLELDLTAEQAILSSLQAKAEALIEHMVRARAELKTINDTEVLLSQLHRDKEIHEFNYRRYSRRLEQSRIDGVLENEKISNIRVFQAPTVPLKPVRPVPLLNLFLGLVLGLFGGLGLVLLTDYLDHSFKKPEDIEEKLDVPALGVVPALFIEGVPSKEKRPGVPVKFNAASRLKKPCETCLERLLASAKRQSKKQRILSISIISCHKGEGVSTISAYFAAALAERSEGRVMLVDANLQDPLAHRIFGLNLSPGLADILIRGQSQSSIIHPSTVNNLDLLCAGKSETEVNPRLFESKAFTDLLNFWKSEYSFVIFDTPAVWEENHAVSLGSVVDGVIMVIEAEGVRWEVAQRAKNRLTDTGSNIIGGILNKRRFYVPKWLYSRL